MTNAHQAPTLEEAAVVDEDLGYLIDDWEPRLDRRELRHLSPALRRLLSDGQYARAWRTLGFNEEPGVTATDLDAMLGALDRDLVRLAFAPSGPEVFRAVARGGTTTLRTPGRFRADDLL